MTTPESREAQRQALIAAGAIPADATEEQFDYAAATPNRWVPSPAVRTWLYGIIAAVVPLLVVLGILTPDVGGHVLSIAAAVLATGGAVLAAKNTPR